MLATRIAKRPTPPARGTLAREEREPDDLRAVGQVITYTFTITNSGATTLPGPFAVTDNRLGSVSPCGSGPLASGASTTCTATHTIVQADLTAGSLTNTADGLRQQRDFEPGDRHRHGPAQLGCGTLAREEREPTTYSAVGQVITYTFTITNSGATTLPGPFAVTDNRLGSVSPCGSGPLASGASTTCTATHTIVQADLTAGSLTNTATASGNSVTSNQATATVTALPSSGAALSLVKSASPTTYSAVGQVITYTFTITNSGATTLPGPFAVTDNRLGSVSPCGSGPLASGASTTAPRRTRSCRPTSPPARSRTPRRPQATA